MTDPTSTLLAAATVEARDGLTVDVRTGHHTFVSDEPKDRGGADLGPAPYQLLLGSLGACTAITLTMYAQRKGYSLSPLKVRLTLKREGEQEKVERAVTVGAQVTAEQRQRLQEISQKTPVTKTLLKALAITTTVEAV